MALLTKHKESPIEAMPMDLETNGTCVLQDHLKTKVLGRLSHSLYYVDIPSPTSSSQTTTCVAAEYSTSNKKNIDLAKLWHLRLGHVPVSQLKVLFPTINVNKFHDSIFCTICLAIKQTRQPFPSSSIKTTRSFQLIHIDTWGPYRYVTHDG